MHHSLGALAAAGARQCRLHGGRSNRATAITRQRRKKGCSGMTMIRPKRGSLLVLAVISATLATATPASAQSTSCLPSQLKGVLSKISSKFGRVQVISTHRPGARIAGSGRQSYHATCRAVDFHPPAGKYGAVVAWLKSNHSGGIGTYSGSHNHIHIDSGPSVVFHKGGGGSRYAKRSGSRRRG